MSLEGRIAKLEAVVVPEETGALAEVARLMVRLWGDDWPAVLLALTTAGCNEGDGCWACEVLRWFGYRADTDRERRARANAEASARYWTLALSKGPLEPERKLPMMSPFFGKDISYEWKRLHGIGGQA